MSGRLFPRLLLVTVIAGCGQSKPATVAPAPPAHFRGYAILGKVEITDPAARQEIVKAVLDGISESDGTVASCFWPRHGVQVLTNGKAVDYVICYECLQGLHFLER